MKMPGTIILFALLAILGAGCGKQARISDEAERDHPAMRKARDLENAGDRLAARLTYESLLDKNPSIARAHLGLAFLQDQDGDYPDAIYHFKRYLALRPDTEKRKMIEAHMREIQLLYAGTIFTNQAAMLKYVNILEKENVGMKVKVANLETQTAYLRSALVTLRAKYEQGSEQADRKLGAGDIPVPEVRPVGKLVRVGKGDTLRKIAARLYHDQSRWREIYDANRKLLKTPEDVKVGQTLLVPVRE